MVLASHLALQLASHRQESPKQFSRNEICDSDKEHKMSARRSALGPILRNAATLIIGGALFLAVAQGQTFNVIYNFTGLTDGANPYAGVTMDAVGNL